MQPYEKIHDYAKAVCGQIKWKKAHPAVREEIENHLVDQRNAYMAEGEDEAAATDQAIVQMGDPVTVGVQLNRTHRPKPPWVMLGLIVAMICIGIGFKVFFMRPWPIFYWADLSWVLDLLVQMMIGAALMAAAYFMDFTWIGRRPIIVYLLLIILFDVLVKSSQGYSMPLLFPISFAGVVYSARNRGYFGIILCGIAFLIPALIMLLVWSKTMISYFIFFAVSALVILCVAISKNWFRVKLLKAYLLVFVPVAIGLLLAVVFVMSDSDKLERVQTAFNPSFTGLGKDSSGTHIKAALAGSKFIGQGTVLDSSIGEPGYSIFSILTSCIFYNGWISVIPVIGLLLFFIIKGFRLCLKQKSGLALLVSVSVMMTFTMQVASYVLLNLGFDLFVPLSLPLIMQLSSLDFYINSALVGILLSVFRTGHIVKDKDVIPMLNHRFII